MMVERGRERGAGRECSEKTTNVMGVARPTTDNTLPPFLLSHASTRLKQRVAEKERKKNYINTPLALALKARPPSPAPPGRARPRVQHTLPRRGIQCRHNRAIPLQRGRLGQGAALGDRVAQGGAHGAQGAGD